MLVWTLTGGSRETAVGCPQLLQLDVNRRPHISLQKVEITLSPSTACNRSQVLTYHLHTYVFSGNLLVDLATSATAGIFWKQFALLQASHPQGFHPEDVSTQPSLSLRVLLTFTQPTVSSSRIHEVTTDFLHRSSPFAN